MKRKILFLAVLLLTVATLFIISNTVNAVDNTLPSPDGNQKITLNNDVTLTSTYQVTSDKNITIDLNGHTLTGPNSGYTIDNLGKLKIVDNGATKGKIVGGSGSSAVRNNGGSLQISGVIIESPFICVKNEPDKMTIINDSTLTSTSNDGHTAILNYGDLAVTHSVIKGTNKGGAVLTAKPTDGAQKKAQTTLTDCTVSAEEEAPIVTDTDTTVTMNGGELEGKLGLNQKGTLQVKGTVEAQLSSNITKFLQKGSTLVLAENQTVPASDYTIEEGVTLKVNDGVELTFATQKLGKNTFSGSLTVKGTVEGNMNGNAVYNKNQNVYYGNLERAFASAEDDNTLVLLGDVEAVDGNSYQGLTNSKKVTLDLNGNTVTGDIVNKEGATAVFEDSSLAKTGKVDGTITNNGTLTIKSGNYTHVPVTATGATTILNGGTYPVDEIKDVVIPEGKEFVKNADGTYSLVNKVVAGEEQEENASSKEKDNTPKSGVENVMGYVCVVAVATLAGIVVLKRKMK